MEGLFPFTELVAGDAWSWNPSPHRYPSSSYTLKYFLRGTGEGATLDIVATAGSGTGFAVAVAGTATADLPAGTYAWQACVFDADGNRTQLGHGPVDILPDIQAQGAGYDGRSYVRKTLDAIRAVIQGRASRVEQHYQIAGRALQLMQPKELLELEGEFAARYRRELIASGQISRNTADVRANFGGAGHLPTEWK